MTGCAVAWTPEVLADLAPYHAAAGGRGGLYRVLARCFRAAPDAAFLASLRETAFVAAAGEAFGEEVAEALRGLPGPTEEVLAAAAEDYTALLKVATGCFVKPWESVWRERRVVDGRMKDGLLMGACTRVVAHFYEEAGAVLDTLGLPELPDHLATEMDFLGFLAAREDAAFRAERVEEAASDLSLSLQFLDEHVLGWVPDLLEAMAGQAGTPFYRTAALLGQRYLAEEDRFLEGAREVLGRPRPGAG